MAKTLIYSPTRLDLDSQKQSKAMSEATVAFLVKVLGGLFFHD